MLRVSWHSPLEGKDEVRRMLCFTFEYYIDFEDILNELYSRLSCGNIAIIMIAHDVFRNRE